MKVRQLKVVAQCLIDQYRVSKQRACQVAKLHRSALYYIKQRRDDEAICKRITEIVQTRMRNGFQRIRTLLPAYFGPVRPSITV